MAALLLLVPTLANGYPLMYPESGTYLLQAIELYGAPDRPPFYSLLIYPFHVRLSLWPVAAMQALALAWAIRITMRSLLGEVRLRPYLVTVALLTLFTSLPWHVGTIVPDVFTAVLALLAFELSYGWVRYNKRERALLAFLACGISTLHFSHLPLAIGVFVVAALVRVAQGSGLRDALRVVVVGWTITKVGSLAFLAYSYVLVRKPTLSPNTNLYMAARVLADGPGRKYLAETCPASGNVLCAYQDRLTDNADDFLLAPSSPLMDALAAHGESAVDKSCGEIVWGVIRTRLGEQLKVALNNSARQFVTLRTLDTGCPARCGEGSSVSRTIREYFAAEYPRFANSAQMQGSLPVAFLRGLDGAVVLLGATCFLGLAILALRRRDALAVGFAAIVVATLVLNAGIVGGLSSVRDRTQSRVIWLLLLATLLLWRRASTAAASPTSPTSPPLRA